MSSKIKDFIKKILIHGMLPIYYQWVTRKNVKKNSVLFIEIRYMELSNDFGLLYHTLSKREEFTIDTAFMGNSVLSYGKYVRQCFVMVKKLATAEYALVNESSNVLAALKVRSETKLIQTWHACGAFKRFGYGSKIPLKESYYSAYDMVSVSSPEVADIYAQSMGQDTRVIRALGVSRTDPFFKQDYIKKQMEMLHKQYPQVRNKKIILFAPTFRGNVQKAELPLMPDIEKLYSHLNETYIILYKGHPAIKECPKIHESCKEFFLDASHLKIENLLCVADLCITDYSSLIFEYALLERPMIFYAYDYEIYITQRGFYYSYEDFVPGPICKDTEELIDAIKGSCDFKEREKVTCFKEKFMSACDGNATQRIIEEMLSI